MNADFLFSSVFLCRSSFSSFTSTSNLEKRGRDRGRERERERERGKDSERESIYPLKVERGQKFLFEGGGGTKTSCSHSLVDEVLFGCSSKVSL